MLFRASSLWFYRLDGKLVVDPREAKVFRKILEMYKQGMSFCGITRALNQQKIPSKTGKKWNRQIVVTVIKRHSGI